MAPKSTVLRFPYGAALERLRRKLRKRRKEWRAFLGMCAQFLPYVRRQRKRFILAQVCSLIYMVLGLLEPWPLKLIFDCVFLDAPLPVILKPVLGGSVEDRFLLLNILIGSVIALAVVRGVFYYYQRLLTGRVGQQMAAAIRVDLYAHLQRLSFSFHDRRRTGDLLNRLTSDIRMLRQILISLPLETVGHLVLMFSMVVVMSLMDLQLTFIAVMVVPCLFMLLQKYRKPMKKAIHKQREREGHLTSVAAEVLGAIKVVQGFHQEKSEVRRFKAQSKNSLRSGMKATRLEAKFKWAADFAVATFTAIVLGVAARRVMAGALSPGDLLVFLAYLKQFNRPLRRISRMVERMARSTACGERVLEMMKVQPAIKDRPGAISVGKVRGEIQYETVHFAYLGGNVALSNISLHVQPGKHIGLVGPTGCGKSSLVSLLPRFYSPSQGRILIDGQDVSQFTLKSLRRNISLVFQESVLFASSVAENIAYGRPDSSMERIRKAAQRAGIHSFIESLPEGYETVVGERGSTLSGGQRQCIAIARALIKNSPIVILDEPITGLDGRSAAVVMQAIEKLKAGRTVLLISHHLQVLRNLDHIYVLRNGHIVEDGSPSTLVSRKGLYRSLLEYQDGTVSL